MKPILSLSPPLEHYPRAVSRLTNFQPRFRSLTAFSLCAGMMAALAGLASAQSLQPTGDLILNLQSVDLDPANTVWTNQTISAVSVGNLSTIGGSAANVASLPYSDSIVGSVNVNALFVQATGNNSMTSSLQVPAEILGRGTVSVEVWAQATDVGSTSATITSAVVAYGNVNNDPKTDHQRDFNYCIGNGNGAVSSYADDAGWTPQTFPTAGVWHYLAYTYDGTTFLAYQDGVLNTTASKPNWNTLSGVMCVGSDGATGGGDPFHGYIASARVMSGVLSAAQISNNFNAGLLAVYGIIPLIPTASPSTNAFLGDTLTLTEVAQTSQTLTYQWESDNGSGGATFTPINGATSSTYVLNTTGLSAQKYEYEVIVTGNSSVTSPPVTIKVNPASLPVLTQDTTPASTSNLFVGSSVTFSATFIGNQPISYQWQANTSGSFVSIPNATNSTLMLANLQLTDSGQYRLTAANSIGQAMSSAVSVNVQPLSALPQLQVAGTLLANLEPQDLNTNETTWTNEINGIGDFTVVGGGNISVTNLTFNSEPINAVAVQGNSSMALNSAVPVPVGITGNGPVSVEAWVYPTSITGNNVVVGYGVQGGNPGAAKEDRELDYGSGGGSAISGDFGNLDTSWNGALTANAWHYLAWTYDGTNFSCYMDGVLNVTQSGASPIATMQTSAVIGAGVEGTSDVLSERTDPFSGNIAAVRISTGVLNASQIANNFVAGPTRTISIVLSTPTLSPAASVFYGDSVTASVTNAQSLQSLTFQWQSDNGSGGLTWSNILGQTDTNYSFSTTSLPRTQSSANYEYRLVATGSGGASVASAPVTLTVRPAAPPTVLTDTSPSLSVLFVGQQVSFSASFTGNQPITTQWQVSTNHGATFSSLSGQTGASLTLTNLQPADAGEYRLEGSNAFGSTNSTPATLIVLPDSAEPAVQVAGELIVDLKSDGLDTNAGVWHNDSQDTNSVGDFTFVGTVGPLSVATVNYNLQPLNVLNVNGVGDNSVESLNLAPSILLGSNPCSMEAWVYATQVNSANIAVNYGDQTSQSGNLDRALAYQNQNYGAFTGYFGDADFGWNPLPTANAWHYIAVTYDGNTITIYQDGVANASRGGIVLATDETYISVGSGTGNSIYAGGNPLSGYVASARVETGVLTAKQIASNYAAGPAPGLVTGVNLGQLVPLQSSYAGGKLTLSWVAGSLQEATSLSGPWTTDTNASPFVVTPASAAAPIKFYRLRY